MKFMYCVFVFVFLDSNLC